MLKFYYHPLSPISRRVLICLLEKSIEFEPVIVQLNLKEQFQPEFLALNPFHHVPVLVDGDVKLIESIAILDYLDARYPTPRMTPIDPVELGKMRMIQMIVMNELMSVFLAIAGANGNLPEDHPKAQTLVNALTFLQSQLGDREFFGGDRLNLADCVAGVTLPLLRRLGASFGDYPVLEAWMARLYARSSWQVSEPSEEAFEDWKRYLQVSMLRSDRKSS